MGMLDALSSGNEGNAEGLVARQNALKAIGSGALSNTPKSTVTPVKAAPAAPAKSTANSPNAKGYGSKAGEKRFKLGADGEILGQFKKGGKVKKTGAYKLHKKERVLNASQTKKFEQKGLLSVLGGKK